MGGFAKKLGWLDLIITAVLIGLAAYVVYRVRVRLDYHWDWSAMGQFFFRFDEPTQTWRANVLIQGLATTLRISLWGAGLAALLGLIFGLFRTGPGVFQRLAGTSYVELVRNLPPLVLIFIFYYFVSEQILPLLGFDYLIDHLPGGLKPVITWLAAPPERLSNFAAAVITLAVYEGAYITEIVRSGIQSIDRGQWEASAGLGMTRLQQMRYVIGPQAGRQIIPPLAGQFISTIKDSAIVSVISVPELTFQGLELMSATYLTFETWLIVTGLYFCLTFGCSWVLERLFITLRRT